MIWRAILGAVAGYVAMALLVMTCFTAAWVVLGAEGSFEPASWEPNGTWLAMSFLAALVAAMVGGLTAVAIGRQPAVLALASLTLVLGLVTAVLQMAKPPVTTPRPAQVSNQEAATNAEQPTWVAWLNPLVGVAGVLIGGSLRRREG